MKEEKEQFDHLILITSGNEEIKAAYYAGFNDGRAKGDEVANVVKFDSVSGFLIGIDDRMKELEKFNVFNSEDKRDLYRNGLNDAVKIFYRHFQDEGEQVKENKLSPLSI